ncbi:glycerophosphodiester phosphodiesterase family protein [Shivajiella indica]|uniref:Glycerophosphodiester phosphodiesterase family protein n=1 Tax=Shivajiella indica TaxID=872115 RepID=A0ABW5BBT0_9BACT
MNKYLLALMGFLLFSCNQQTSKTVGANADSDGLLKIVIHSLEDTRHFFTWSDDRTPMVSAHRGGPYPGYPENSLEAFENTLKYTHSIIEFDVALTKDSVLVLMHDNTLDRTTTAKGNVIDWTFDELKDVFLVDANGNTTDYRIPTLDEALAWGKGKTLFTVDIKREVPFEMVVEAIKKHQAEPYAAVITYSVEAAKKLHRLHPDLMLSVTIRNEEELQRFEGSGIPVNRWIAFIGTAERPKEFNEMLHEKGVFTILGVLGNLDRSAVARGDQIYAEFVENGADILATDRPIETAEAIKGLVPEGSSKGKYFKN